MTTTPRIGKQIRSRRVSITGIALLGLIVLSCLVVPLVWPHDPDAIVGQAYLAPSRSHPFGTDEVGRDVFVRVFSGGRLDIVIAGIIVIASMFIGTLVGIVAGLTNRKWLDGTMMRAVDALIAFPFIVLVLALIVTLGPDRTFGPLPAGAPAIIVAMLFVNWAVYARLSRGQMRTLRSRDYVVAVELLGLSRWRIIRRHLSPAVLRVTASYAVSDAILVIVTTASLSFLGLGIQPPSADWGAMMFEGRAVIATSWWVTVTPGIALGLTGLGLTLLGDSLLNEPGRRS